MLELRYDVYPLERSAAGRLAVDLPEFRPVASARRLYWELVAPRTLHLLAGPARFASEATWVHDGLVWTREPALDQAELESLLGTSTGLPARLGTNRYLFSTVGTTGPLDIWVVSRSALVFTTSLLLLGIGLTLIYFPRLRHPGLVLTLAVAVIAASLIDPEAAVLLAQASVLGVALVLVAVVLARRTLRQRGPRPGRQPGERLGHARSDGHAASAPAGQERSQHHGHGGGGANLRAGKRAMMRPLLAAVAAGVLLLPRLALAADAPAAGPHDPAANSATANPAAAGRATSPPAAPKFRRIYAPAARLQDWPLGNVPYLPMEVDEFDRLIAAVHHSDRGAPRATGAQLLRADYQAQLRGPDVLEGEATLSIEHRTAQAVLLALDPLGLAVSQASWQSGASGAAVLGRSSDGRIGVMVERSGDLRLAWTLRGERGPSGEMTFALELPACPSGHLTIDLPANLVPSVDRGLVRQADRPAGALRRWSIDVGGGRRLVVRLISTDAVRPRRPLALVRQTTEYEFSPRGVDVSLQLRLDVHDAPLGRLELQIDPRLQLVAARYADRDIPWTTTAGPGGTGTRAILELPEPILGSGRSLRLSALAPLEEGRPWRLPLIRAEGTTWLEGTVEIVVPKPLVIAQLSATGCRQAKSAPLGAPLAGESLEFQCFSPDAAIDVIVGRPQDALRVDLAEDVELSPLEIKSRTVSELSLRQGEEFVVACEIGPQWVVDAVDSPSAEAIDDWQLEPQDAGPSRLSIRLKKALAPNRPVRLAVTGHRAAQPLGPWGIADLEMLHFPGAERGKAWLALRAAEGQELQLSEADGLVRLDPQQFSPAEAQLFARPPAGIVFALTPSADQLRVRHDSPQARLHRRDRHRRPGRRLEPD